MGTISLKSTKKKGEKMPTVKKEKISEVTWELKYKRLKKKYDAAINEDAVEYAAKMEDRAYKLFMICTQPALRDRVLFPEDREPTTADILKSLADEGFGDISEWYRDRTKARIAAFSSGIETAKQAIETAIGKTGGAETKLLLAEIVQMISGKEKELLEKYADTSALPQETAVSSPPAAVPSAPVAASAPAAASAQSAPPQQAAAPKK